MFNPKRHKPKEVTRIHKGGRGGGVNRTPPSTFDTIHPIDFIFGAYNELSFYIQLIETRGVYLVFMATTAI